jgi:hypothetical protein
VTITLDYKNTFFFLNLQLVQSEHKKTSTNSFLNSNHTNNLLHSNDHCFPRQIYSSLFTNKPSATSNASTPSNAQTRSNFEIEFGFNLKTNSSQKQTNQPESVTSPRKHSVSSSLSSEYTISSSQPSSPSTTPSSVASGTSKIANHTGVDTSTFFLKKNEMNSSVEITNSLNISVNSANEQQRRNKKRKPPNYYQSAEYAAIIKHADDLVQQQQQQQQLLQNSQNSSINQTHESNVCNGDSSTSSLPSPTQQTNEAEARTIESSNTNGKRVSYMILPRKLAFH